MSGLWPTTPIAAVRKVVSYLGYCGRAGRGDRTAVRDPLLSSSSALGCVLHNHNLIAFAPAAAAPAPVTSETPTQITTTSFAIVPLHSIAMTSPRTHSPRVTALSAMPARATVQRNVVLRMKSSGRM
jgi:hypothetical protein